MRIRQLKTEDIPFLQQMHAEQKFDYEFPNIEHPIFFVRLVLVDDDDIPQQSIVLRLTAEAYFLQNKEWQTPGIRLEAFSKLHEAARQSAEAAGLMDIHAWPPPQIEKSFGRRLMNMFGWKQQLWPCFSRETSNG